MYNNLIFVGGIHGVGKGETCSQIASNLDIIHLSASDVLKWEEISRERTNKLVKDIPDTQERLIEGLRNTLNPNHFYILDRHFCLLNSFGKTTRIPPGTFRTISPVLLSIVICDHDLIQERLFKRDYKIYELETLAKMQNEEVSYAHEISELLKIKLIKIEDGDVQPLINAINQIIFR